MRKTTINKSLFLLCAACVMAGCANSESDVERRNQAATGINGASYASAEENEASLFGSESKGLSSNPKTKPSSDKLGKGGVYDNLEVTVVPVKGKGFINEMLAFDVTFVDKDEDGNPKNKFTRDGRFVLTLERPADGNATLIYEGNLADKTNFPPTDTEAVIQAKDAKFSFKISTGNVYNNKGTPMYYVNIWNADLKDPVPVEIEVKKPFQIGDAGVTAGSKDVQNDTKAPDQALFDAAGKSNDKLLTVEIVPKDSLNQQLSELRTALAEQQTQTDAYQAEAVALKDSLNTAL